MLSYRVLSWLDAAFLSVMLRHGSAGGLADSLSVGFFFRGGDLTFRVSGVDYMAFLKNYPIPQEVKGMADGDSLRQLFSFSGLTFPRTHDIVWIPFREPCMSCVGRPAT